MHGGITLRGFTSSRFTIRGALIRGALPAFAGALVLAGCASGGGNATAAATGSSASATGSAALSAFATCLKQHGVKVAPGQFSGRPGGAGSPRAIVTGSPRAVPSGSPRPGLALTGANAAAVKACAKDAPAGFGGGAHRVISSSALAAFKSCLGRSGVKVSGTTANAILAELRNATGKTATAVHTCRVLLQPTVPTPSASASA
ncbi:MAG TPA: hypothetical protein VHF26_02460 [Trebonia sp.]|nr:hypothetical protein [Trebonia sp.]